MLKHSEIFLTFLDVYLAAIINHKILTIKLFQRHEAHIQQCKTELFRLDLTVEEEVDSAFDCVDGIRPQISAERSGTLSPPPSLHRDTSYGFDVQSGAEVWNGGDGNFQSNYPSDSVSRHD